MKIFKCLCKLFTIISHLHDHSYPAHTTSEVKNMKENEKKPLSWEAADPKPPVIQSGHLENKTRN